MHHVQPKLYMFTNRVFLPFVAISVSSAALAGPINIISTSESSNTWAYVGVAGYDRHSQSLQDVSPIIAGSTASISYGAQSAEVDGSNYQSLEHFGATDRLTGNAASSGSTFASPGIAIHSGYATNTIQFSLSQSSLVNYYLSASSYGFSSGDSLYNGGAFVELTSYVDGSWHQVSTGSTLAASGIFGAGTYMLTATASNSSRTDGSGVSRVSSSGYYTLDATAVPEPATMAVLGVGSFALLRRRNKA